MVRSVAPPDDGWMPSAGTMNDEVFAGIKVLIALAQADGTVHDDERIAIENALDGEELPDGATIASLLAAEIDKRVGKTYRVVTREEPSRSRPRRLP